MPDALLGPAALLVGSLIAVGVLWREHMKADADDRKQRDEALELLKGLAPSVKQMADAWDARNRADAARRRRNDQ